MNAYLSYLLFATLVLTAISADPPPPCKDSAADTCVADADGNPTFCVDLVFQFHNGSSTDKSTCASGACADKCVGTDTPKVTCDASACDSNLCTCTMDVPAATDLLTGLLKGTLSIAAGAVATVAGLVVGIAAAVPNLIQQLTGGLSLDKVVGIVGEIPIVGGIVTGVLKNLGILDIAGKVLGAVLNLSNGLVGAAANVVGGVAGAATGLAGGLVNTAAGLVGGLTGGLGL